MKPSIVIVDYGMGNLRSVQKAFEACGAGARVTSSRRDIERAAKIVLPGVGAFDCAMAELKKRRLVEPLKEKIAGGTPYLGICLGLQLLFTYSEEARRGEKSRGLGVIPGWVRRFGARLKVPHMGWNRVEWRRRCPFFQGLRSGEYFYFVHSYYGVSEDPSWRLARTRYGRAFLSAAWRGNVFATQFHPEKSQAQGLAVIRNFVEAA